MRVAAWFVALTGCGFQAFPQSTPGPSDAPRSLDAPPDAAVDLPVMYATSQSTLYAIDVDQHTAMMIGAMTDGTTTYDVDGLTYSGSDLIGIPGSHDKLLRIDPTTARVTAAPAFSPVKTYWALGTAAAGEVDTGEVTFAGTNSTDGKLYRVDVAASTATAIGSFGGGMSISGDVAWVRGRGLYGTMVGGSCNPDCIARIDHTTGAATVLNANAPSLTGVSGYRGQLWALSNSGDGKIYSVDPDTGALTPAFSVGTTVWWEGAQ